VQKQPIDERLMTDYLLGALSETETERLDKMSLIDGEFADRLLVVEDDLVDSYARGELSGDLLNRFTSHYLASPRSREKVKVARTLLLFADNAATASVLDSEAITRASSTPGKAVLRHQAGRPGFFAMPRLALQWGFAAAALVFLVAGGYLAYENLRLRHEVTRTKTERAALEQREQELQRQLVAQRSADAETEQELTQVRERLSQLESQQPTDQPREPLTVAFNLSPQTRGAGQVPTITVPAGIDSVALKLDVEATGFPRYQLALKDSASGQITWRSARLRATGAALRVSVPAGLLKSQNYVLELSGTSAAGDAENVANYPFRVIRR
jgi:hypothetical protein